MLLNAGVTDALAVETSKATSVNAPDGHHEMVNRGSSLDSTPDWKMDLIVRSSSTTPLRPVVPITVPEEMAAPPMHVWLPAMAG